MEHCSGFIGDSTAGAAAVYEATPGLGRVAPAFGNLEFSAAFATGRAPHGERHETPITSGPGLEAVEHIGLPVVVVFNAGAVEHCSKRMPLSLELPLGGGQLCTHWGFASSQLPPIPEAISLRVGAPGKVSSNACSMAASSSALARSASAVTTSSKNSSCTVPTSPP
jgi:hypothetical protein